MAISAKKKNVTEFHKTYTIGHIWGTYTFAPQVSVWYPYLRGVHVCTQDIGSVYVLWYSVTFIWPKRILIHQITSNLGFSIPFHLYIHDHDLEQASDECVFKTSFLFFHYVSFMPSLLPGPSLPPLNSIRPSCRRNRPL